jgi:hypothetical protein
MIASRPDVALTLPREPHFGALGNPIDRLHGWAVADTMPSPVSDEAERSCRHALVLVEDATMALQLPALVDPGKMNTDLTRPLGKRHRLTAAKRHRLTAIGGR